MAGTPRFLRQSLDSSVGWQEVRHIVTEPCLMCGGRGREKSQRFFTTGVLEGFGVLGSSGPHLVNWPPVWSWLQYLLWVKIQKAKSVLLDTGWMNSAFLSLLSTLQLLRDLPITCFQAMPSPSSARQIGITTVGLTWQLIQQLQYSFYLNSNKTGNSLPIPGQGTNRKVEHGMK